jgi:hypothetical protein
MTSLRLLNLPFLGLQQHTRVEFFELCGNYKTPSRISHFSCTLSHLERVAHRPKNLLLQPQPPLSPGESISHRLGSLLPQICSNTRRMTRLNKEQMKVSNHSLPRDCMATTNHSYIAHSIDNCSDFIEDDGSTSEVYGYAEVQCRDKTVLGKDSSELR